MSKRLIDTEIFDYEWFMQVSKDAKIFWFYIKSKCNHAGVIDLNNRLCKFQTEIESIESVVKELGNHIVTLSNGLLFIPEYFKEQYPNFPDKSFKAAHSAFSMLLELGVDVYNLGIDEEKLKTYISVNKDLPKCTGNSICICNSNIKSNSKENPKTVPKVEKEKFNFKKSLINLGIDEKLVMEWLKVRKNKKLTNTETAFDRFVKQVNLSGLLPSECLTIAVAKSWGGFEARWLESLKLDEYIDEKGTDLRVKALLKEIGENKR